MKSGYKGSEPRLTGLFEKDYSSVLGLSLSLLSGRLVSRCYVAGKDFHFHEELSSILHEIKEIKSIQSDINLYEAITNLEVGLTSLLSVGRINVNPVSELSSNSIQMDPNLHAHFFKAGVAAIGFEKVSSNPRHSSPRLVMNPDAAKEEFYKILLGYKIQIICAFFQKLESNYGVLRRYPQHEIVGINPVEIVENKIMCTRFVRDAQRSLKMKGWTIPRRQRSGKKKKPAGAAKGIVAVARVKDIPILVSYVLTESLSVDRIVQTYLNSSREVSMHAAIFNIKENLSVLQEKCKIKSDIGNGDSRTAIVSLRASSNLVTKGTTEKKIRLLSESNFTPLGNIELSDENATQFASNKFWFIAGYKNGNIDIFDIETRKLVTTLNEHKGAITSFTIDTNGKRLFSSSLDGSLLEWDRDANQNWNCKGNLSRQLKTKSPVTSLTTDEGVGIKIVHAKYLLSGHKNGQIDVWNLLSSETSLMFSIKSAHKSRVSLLVCRAAEFFSAGDDNIVKVWDITQKACVQPLLQNSRIRGLVINNDCIFTACDYNIRAYDRNDFMKVFEIELPEKVTGMSLDRNGNLITSEISIRRWNVEGLSDIMQLDNRGRPTFINMRAASDGGISMNLDHQRKRHQKKKQEQQKNGRRVQSLRIKEILENPRLRSNFMAFLKHSYADETLSFWIAVQRYQDFWKQGNCETEAIGRLGMGIVQDYIKYDSPKAININHHQREKLTVLELQDFELDTFDDTVNEVLALMEKNFVYEFKRTFAMQ